jgi:hypothetical protein
MAVPAKKKPSPQPFPKDHVEASLRDWWAQQEQDQKLISDPVEDLQPTSETVFAVVPLVSSHHALNAVLEVEKIVGYEIPDSVVKRGGYQDCEEFVKHMMGRLDAYHAKQ